jgi:hypothetical protein
VGDDDGSEGEAMPAHAGDADGEAEYGSEEVGLGADEYAEVWQRSTADGDESS